MQTAELRKKILSETTLKRGAIKVGTKDPFTWASKTKNPFYNNNRVLLDKYEDRMLVGQSLVELAEELGIEYDAVLGTSMAGIGPAATVAELTGKPLLINHEGTFYKFEVETFFDQSEDMRYFETFSNSTDVISATVPFGIPHGVWLANKTKKRFSFVRPKPKTHGLGKQVEGKPQPDDKVLLMNYFQGDEKNYTKEAIEGIEAEGGVLKHFYNCNFPQHKFISVVNVSGLRVLVIEDLVSTGGSSYKEVTDLSCRLPREIQKRRLVGRLKNRQIGLSSQRVIDEDLAGEHAQAVVTHQLATGLDAQAIAHHKGLAVHGVAACAQQQADLDGLAFQPGTVAGPGRDRLRHVLHPDPHRCAAITDKITVGSHGGLRDHRLVIRRQHRVQPAHVAAVGNQLIDRHSGQILSHQAAPRIKVALLPPKAKELDIT